MPNDLTGRERLPALPESEPEQVEVAKQRHEFCKTIAIEVLGWTMERREVIYNHRKWKDWDTWFNRDGVECVELPDFLRDYNAARLALAEIERRGLTEQFVDALEDLIWPSPVEISEGAAAMGFLTATPEAICRAALSAVRGGKP